MGWSKIRTRCCSGCIQRGRGTHKFLKVYYCANGQLDRRYQPIARTHTSDHWRGHRGLYRSRREPYQVSLPILWELSAENRKPSWASQFQHHQPSETNKQRNTNLEEWRGDRQHAEGWTDIRAGLYRGYAAEMGDRKRPGGVLGLWVQAKRMWWLGLCSRGRWRRSISSAFWAWVLAFNWRNKHGYMIHYVRNDDILR